ncbi:hypothetical protein ECO2947_28325 (plasmid) [Escherichia coli]|nr:hypothetical protein ECO2947_28325 [Escherichia coli]CAK5470886.1 hypothetical protein ECO1752_28085 [Escherichia coli]
MSDPVRITNPGAESLGYDSDTMKLWPLIFM